MGTVDSGRAREVFDAWAHAQGAEAGWLTKPDLALAPHEAVIEAPHEGVLQAVDCRELGLLMVEAGAGRSRPSEPIDNRVSLRYQSRLGDAVAEGQELARLYLRREDAELQERFAACFEVGREGEAVDLIIDRIDGDAV